MVVIITRGIHESVEEGFAGEAASSPWYFLIVLPPQKRRSNAPCAEITRAEQSETEER